MDNDALLQDLIKGCLTGKKEHQKELYKALYSFVYGIALRYARNGEEASIILNKGFYSAFNHLRNYKETTRFKEWLRCLLATAAIEYYMDKTKPSAKRLGSKISDMNSRTYNLETGLSYMNCIKMLHQIPDSCRIVFNLFVIDGYEHQKIARLMNISIYDSESLLRRARKKLGNLISTDLD